MAFLCPVCGSVPISVVRNGLSVELFGDGMRLICDCCSFSGDWGSDYDEAFSSWCAHVAAYQEDPVT